MRHTLILLSGIVLLASPLLAESVQPRPFKAADAAPDAIRLLSPADIHLNGFLGRRIADGEKNRLLNVNEDELLGGFRKRPGSHPWIGEHVGKFLHAATLTWAYTGDAQLKAKIDRVAAELIKCQLPDGYLGTYVDKERWTSWDVWSHKYDLMGLLTYYQYTGNEPALNCCRRVGDLLIATFPKEKSILAAGTHVGMAATSVLEGVVLLYRFTGEQKYLNFAKYIVSAYDEPNGPKVVKTLLDVKRVDKTANGKAYEMMSNLVGLCEMYRATGEKDYLTAASNAWDDIVANHLYITGSVSQGEHFHAPHDLPNGENANVAETCATVTYIQLTQQLLRLTGEAKYGEQLEKTFYNHLSAAQRPDGAMWCYFTPLTGKKPYGNSVNCCLSSGPRGMAMIPQVAAFAYKADGEDGIAVNLMEAAQITARLGGQEVVLTGRMQGDEDNRPQQMPLTVAMTYTMQMNQPMTFAFKVRCPAWVTGFKLRDPEGKETAGVPGAWTNLPARQWKTNDRITASFTVAPRLIAGDYTNKGYNALAFGPFVLAYDENVNQGLPPSALAMLHAKNPPDVKVLSNSPFKCETMIRTAADPQTKAAAFVHFADAGADGGRYRVWLRDPSNTAPLSLLSEGRESRSRRGNLSGSITDDDPATFVVTYDGKPAAEDWFAVTLSSPATFKRIVYAHGKFFHDGGWFDASAGKPKIQVQRQAKGPWETIGTLDEYPATTATDAKGLRDGQSFTLRLAQPVTALAVRVIGKPASGDKPGQAFSSCAELAAYPD